MIVRKLSRPRANAAASKSASLIWTRFGLRSVVFVVFR
ncbi:hypothetical protein CDS [Bradyrhizobium sp.]|nr:hypothetical protein CDS [Bradyrhizobium sp.]